MSLRNFPVTNLVLILALLLLVGCSGSGDPVSPDANNADNIEGNDKPDIVEVTPAPGPVEPQEKESAYKVLWGYYDINVDTETLEYEVIPLRNADYTFNVNKFLQPPAGSAANLALGNWDISNWLSEGRIGLDLTITHPFPLASQLRGFDVMGVFMGDGSLTGYDDHSLIYPKSNGDDAYLTNADGYTRWMNATEFTQQGLLGFTPGSKGIPGFVPDSIINGYKWFSTGLDAGDDISDFFQTQANVDARGSFPAGSSLSRRYEIRFPLVGGSPQLRFQYAILASWAAADPGSLPDPDVGDFPSEANLQEPFFIAASDNGSDLFYETSSDLGGTLKLNIEIYDWQAVGEMTGVYGQLSELYIEDAAGAVIPGGSVDVLTTAVVTATADNGANFEVEIPNCTPTGPGRQEFLITAVSDDPTNYNNGLGAPFPMSAKLSAYQRVKVMVADENPCPDPDVSATTGIIHNVNDVVTQMPITGTGLAGGDNPAAELRRTSGDVIGTNIIVLSTVQAEADFDLTGYAAGMYDFYWRNGCGLDAPLVTGAFEINTPPTSTGITGPSTGDGTLGTVQWNANASDADTDPVDTLSYTWNIIDQGPSGNDFGPFTGDPLSFNYATLPLGSYDVQCVVSDGYVPADLELHYSIQRTNTQPSVLAPVGMSPVWVYETFLYQAIVTDPDPGQIHTYLWSLVPQGQIPSYTLPGDPTPGDITINWSTAVMGAGFYELSCQVDDGSGAPNAIATSANLLVYVSNPPYTDPIPPVFFNQTIAVAAMSLQGIAGCPSYWDSFYGALGGVPFSHPDISIISGPSIGVPGVMVIADETGLIAGPYPPPPPQIMGWAHYTNPFATGAPPSWTWLTTGLFPNGPDMIPSVIHYDGNSQGDMLATNSMLTNKLAGAATPDMSAFQHYTVGAPPVSDLYTSLPAAAVPDVAVDCTGGFDHGDVANPQSAPVYGLFTQDLGGILQACGGPVAGALAANPVHLFEFPAGGLQPAGTPVDLAGSLAVVAPIPGAFVGPGPGMINIAPGGPCPAGAITFPEPYCRLGVDSDPQDNDYPSNLPVPIGKWVLGAIIDGDRDVEIWEFDFGVPPPGPAPSALLATIPMGSFQGGNVNAIPVDLEFISNYSGYQGTFKPVLPEDLLAVLLVDNVAGIWFVEIFSIQPGTPMSLSTTLPVPTPPGPWPIQGVAFSIDVDELTGDLYVLHEDTLGGGNLTVTIISY